MADELTARIVDLVAKALAEREAAIPASSAPAAIPAPAPPPAPSPTVVTAGRIVTREDVQRAAKAGAALQVPAGAILTDLAREEAETQGVAILSGGASGPVRALRAAPAPAAPAAVAEPSRGTGMEPATYSRAAHDVARSTDEMIARLEAFTELVWRSEPNEVRRLRQLSRPPMGQLPGIFYACFNLFWLGEETQTLRDKAKAGAIPVAVLNELLATLCARHALRLSKWYLVDSLELLGDVERFLAGPGCGSHDEFRRLTESLLLAIDRIQAWVDRMIPWHTLDAKLELVP
jgi:hypothetical protein